MKKGIIFDLDQTLVDSSSSEIYRGKNWKKAVSLIPGFVLYGGFADVFEFIKENNLKVSIVSTSVSYYVEAVLKHFNIPFNKIIAYHDVARIKPDQEGMNKALLSMGLSAEEVISFGDKTSDIIASNRANIDSVACLWGAEGGNEIASIATYTISNPREIIPLLKR